MKILIGGDFYPVLPSGRQLDLNDNIWNNVELLINDHDFRVLNLECPITNSNTPIDKIGPNLKVTPQAINLLTPHFDMLTLANNHIFDYGSEGLNDTLDICDKEKILTIGAGNSTEEKTKTTYQTINDKLIGFINIAENEWNSDINTEAGAHCFDNQVNTLEILNAIHCCDHVIIIVHGGSEMYSLPSPRVVALYRYYIDLGVDAVVSHHSHVLSGYEYYKGKPIAYGIGNLVFPSNNSDPRWHIGAFASLTLTENDKFTLELKVFRQTVKKDTEEFRLSLLDGNDKAEIINEIRQLNNIIKNEKELLDNWEEFILSRRSFYLSTIIFPHDLLRKIYLKFFKKIDLVRYRPLKFVLHMIRCESHRDALITCLKYRDK